MNVDEYANHLSVTTERIMAFCGVIGDVLQPVLSHVVEVYTAFIRMRFRIWLVNKRVPYWLAVWIADHWPLKWIPPLERLILP